MTPADMAARLSGCKAYDGLSDTEQDALCRDLIRIPALIKEDEGLRMFADQKEHTRRSAKLQSVLSTVLDVFSERQIAVVHAMEAFADHPLGEIDAFWQFRAMAEAMRDHLARLDLASDPFPGRSWLEARLIVLQREARRPRQHDREGKSRPGQCRPRASGAHRRPRYRELPQTAPARLKAQALQAFRLRERFAAARAKSVPYPTRNSLSTLATIDTLKGHQDDKHRHAGRFRSRP